MNIVKYVDDEGDNSPANQVLYGCFLCLVPFKDLYFMNLICNVGK